MESLYPMYMQFLMYWSSLLLYTYVDNLLMYTIDGLQSIPWESNDKDMAAMLVEL